MRYVLPAVIVVIGLITGMFGVLQKTVWAPDDTRTASVQLDGPGPVVVVEPGVLNLYDTPATLTATATAADQEITISRTTKENADFWVGASDATRIVGLAEEDSLESRTFTGGEGAPEAGPTDVPADEAAEDEAAEDEAAEPDPEELATVPAPGGADLWEATESGEGTVSWDFDEDAGRTAFVIGTDGEQPAASDVSITWPNDTATPWAIPLMIGGGVIVLIGLGVGFMSLRSAKRDKERRTARQERRRKLAETGSAFAIVPVIALAGCGPAELPQPDPDPAPTDAGPAVTDDQIASILDKARSTVAGADEELDEDALAERASGPFLAQRSAAYDVKDASEDFELPPGVADGDVEVNFTAATDTWPRATSVIVEDTEIEQSRLLVLAQSDARADYTVWSQTVLQPGAEIPEISDPREGSALLDPEAGGYRLLPNEVPAAYADVLSEGDESDSAEAFEEDAFASQVRSNQASQSDELEAGGAEVTFSYAGDDSQLTAMEAADGSAVVTGVVEAESTISPDSTESTTGTLTIPSPAADVIGETETSEDLTQTSTVIATWVVPAGAQEPIRLVGVNETFTGASVGTE
ncbi:hypothetical protein [Brevibacterium jeotgali]|uniref:DUF8094 domain-containing protein n=1 Tax=Brevibacterium jeotgali TaxID=1262550 RepID=A0A2H1L7F7_9MICO|nr:hypothetical protein [Brevibacterium jeotgali]TWC02243.1 hypothetical protein FB108_0914 [Brevibacterium jeotgali]SMY12705.1 hypothetical protein BJEO58_02305 [Brevibacterium jeotgali]